MAHEGESHKKTLESRRSRHLSLFLISRCVYWMSTSALSTLLPQTMDRSDANLWKCAISLSMFSLWLPTFNLCNTAENNGQTSIASLVRA